MRKNVLLSIIIPIYNVAKYLPFCIESVIKQDISNVEIILINDGSTDDCDTICRRYGSLNNQYIFYISQPNKGLSVARNQGIAHSSGKYIMFIDSDDFIIEETLSEIKDIIHSKEPDVIFGQIDAFKENNVFRDFLEGTIDPEINKMSTDEIVLYLSNADINISPSVRYIINLDFIKTNSLYFENIPYEDVLWSSKVLTYVNKIYIYNKKFYKYRLRYDSLSSSKNFEMYFTYARIVLNLYALIDGLHSRQKIKFIHNRCRYLLYRIRNEMHTLDEFEEQKLKQFFIENEDMIKRLYSFD